MMSHGTKRARAISGFLGISSTCDALRKGGDKGDIGGALSSVLYCGLMGIWGRMGRGSSRSGQN